MKETLYGAQGLDETRIRRAFKWVVTFRDFPVGSYQTVDGDSMMTLALTLFTKGRAEFFLDGVRRGDRLPGILSSEHEPVGQGGTFKIVYVEPTTRVCIPALINRSKLPNVSKIELLKGDSIEFQVGRKMLICLGSVQLDDRVFFEEQSFSIIDTPKTATALSNVILLDFTES